jgi:hypothetical protein
LIRLLNPVAPYDFERWSTIVCVCRRCGEAREDGTGNIPPD